MLRFDPFRELDRLVQGVGARAAAMPLDAYRQGDRFTINLDLPGVDPGSIDLTVGRDALSVAATRSWEPAEGDQVIASERPQGRFQRQLFLGEGLDVEHLEAEYRDGVLTITAPVAEHDRPRKVAITTGAGATPQALGQSTAA